MGKHFQTRQVKSVLSGSGFSVTVTTVGSVDALTCVRGWRSGQRELRTAPCRGGHWGSVWGLNDCIFSPAALHVAVCGGQEIRHWRCSTWGHPGCRGTDQRAGLPASSRENSLPCAIKTPPIFKLPGCKICKTPAELDGRLGCDYFCREGCHSWGKAKGVDTAPWAG